MRPVILALAGLVAAASAQGQTMRYPVKTMDFDIWCTEEMHYSSDRCDKRLPEDMKKFDDYRAIIERYEIPYLQQKEQKIIFDRDILHNDPVDNKPSDDNDQSKHGGS